MNSIYTYKFSFEELSVSSSQLEKVMGYDPGSIPEPFNDIISKVFIRANSFDAINGGIIIFENISFETINKTLKINNVLFDIKNTVYQQLKKSQQIAVYVCTAGLEIGEWSRELMADGDLMKGYVADVMGSIIVETTMDKMQKLFENVVNEAGFKITNRYSPGNCRWKFEDQHKLFSIIPNNFCGITLSDNALMNPIKSVSGVIGIGKQVKFNPYTCELCDLKTCLYRNRK